MTAEQATLILGLVGGATMFGRGAVRIVASTLRAATFAGLGVLFGDWRAWVVVALAAWTARIEWREMTGERPPEGHQ